MAMKKCPVCGVSVKLENLEKHVKAQHPKERIELKNVLTKEETAKARTVKIPSRKKFEAKRAWPLAVLAIIVVVVVFIALQNPAGSTGINVGDVAPEITLTTTDGNPIRLSDLRGKPTVLEFMDVDCGYCMSEADVLSEVYYERTSVANFFSVDVNFVGESDNDAKINDFRMVHDTWWPYALDSDGVYTKLYGVDGTPRAYILDKEGVVKYIFVGDVAGGKNTYLSAIDALL